MAVLTLNFAVENILVYTHKNGVVALNTETFQEVWKLDLNVTEPCTGQKPSLNFDFDIHVSLLCFVFLQQCYFRIAVL